MADVSEVANGIAALIANAIYPNGTDLPSTAGIGVRIYAGWPAQANLDQDLIAQIAHVSVFPRAEERNTTRYDSEAIVVAMPAPTLTLTVNVQIVTIGGTVTLPQNVALLVSRKPYVYAVQSGDTLTSIATALATLLAVDWPGTLSSGTVLTLPAAAIVAAARVGANGTVAREIRRQERRMQVTLWADTPQHRDTVAQLVDSATAVTRFMGLPDGFGARLTYVSSMQNDSDQKAKLYRRDFIFTAEYPTTQSEQVPAVIVTQTNIIGGGDPSEQAPVATIYQ